MGDFQKRILVATNLFGRGMDIERVNIVFNYDMPEDTDTYLHRVARAGRLVPKDWQSPLFQTKQTLRYLTKYKIDLKLTSRNCPKKLICLLTLRAVNMPCTFLELNAAFCYFFSFVVQNIITLKNDAFIYRIISKR